MAPMSEEERRRRQGNIGAQGFARKNLRPGGFVAFGTDPNSGQVVSNLATNDPRFAARGQAAGVGVVDPTSILANAAGRPAAAQQGLGGRAIRLGQPAAAPQPLAGSELERANAAGGAAAGFRPSSRASAHIRC